MLEENINPINEIIITIFDKKKGPCVGDGAQIRAPMLQNHIFFPPKVPAGAATQSSIAYIRAQIFLRLKNGPWGPATQSTRAYI